MKKHQFEEQFQDSEANFSEVNYVSEGRNDAEGEPIQLISIKRNGKIQVNEQALNIIASYDSPVGFVSMVGKTRTGKSCLLNRLLQLRGTGFKVDPSVSSCTQGIWMWSEPRFNASQDSHIFFLDTEGTDSLQKDIQNDTKIFTLALLIASYFIYNSIGSIDQRSISELQMITALSKQIKADSSLSDRENQQNLHRYMPKFMWVLRDFTLKIEDEKGKKINATQYLQNCLTDKQAGNEDTKKVKKSIINYFRERQCLTLVRPVGDQSNLQRLNSIPDHALRREFIEGVNVLRDKILNGTIPKTFEGQVLTGPAMASIVETYVEAFNSESVPNIKSAWQQIAEDEGAAAYNRAVEKYEQIFRQEFPDDSPKGEEIYRILNRLKEESMKQFQKNSYGQKHEEYLAKLKKLLREKEENIIQINNNVNQVRNHQILKKVAQKMRVKIQNNQYQNSKDQIQTDLKQIMAQYNSEAKGEKKGEILTEFITSLNPIILSLQKDNSADQDEEKRIAKKKLEEYEDQLRLQRQQIQSMRKQMASKQKAENLKPIGNNKVDPRIKQKKEATGCCSGDKCQLI